MTEKQNRKDQTEMQSVITPLTIIGNDRLAPYIQVFTHQPENITQHALGTLFGIFKIDDISVDSAFIVNFLVSEFKKEYYGNPRRTPAGSFEAGLNRINIALSELAKQGNIAWIGKIESALCALEKNGMLHFSATGPAHIALMREGSLSLISDGLAPEATAPNPLKTFIEISSGKLHPEDLVILGTHELFEFLPKEKMERNAKHFSYEEFTRFLHTALVNEFDLCGTVTVLLNKRAPIPKTRKSSSSISPESIPNMFSAKAFRKHSGKKEGMIVTDPEEDSSTQRKNQEGHLYIQQQASSVNDSGQELRETLLMFKERIANILDERITASQNTLRQWRRTLEKELSRRFKKSSPVKPTPIISKDRVPNNGEPLVKKYNTQQETPSLQEISFIRPSQKTPDNRDQKTTEELKLEESSVTNIFDTIFKNSTIKKIGDLLRTLWKKIRTLTPVILGVFQRYTRDLPKAFSHLSRFIQQLVQIVPEQYRKIVPLALAIAIALIAFFLIPKKDNTKIQETPQEITQQEPALPDRSATFSQEKNVFFPKKEDEIALYTSQNTIQNIFTFDEKTLLVLDDSSISIVPKEGAPENFPIPETNGTTLSATYMKDLSTLFVLTDKGSIVSFSPISKKFSNNSLVLEDPSTNKFLLGSYLTYLYVANTTQNTILRYPRAEAGGFGEPLTWLSNDSGVSLSDAIDMTIDGSIYLIKPTGITRLNNKKEDPLTIESPNNPAQFGSIFTQNESDALYVSDIKNNRILLFKKDGSIERQIILPEATPAISKVSHLENSSALILQGEREILQLEQ